MKESVLKDKSYKFAVSVIVMVKAMQMDKKEYILSKQLMKSGTAIGALIREAEYAQSKADYINKFSISLKEANETKYWLCLIKDIEYYNKELVEKLLVDCNEILALLTATIKTLKSKYNK